MASTTQPEANTRHSIQLLGKFDRNKFKTFQACIQQIFKAAYDKTRGSNHRALVNDVFHNY